MWMEAKVGIDLFGFAMIGVVMVLLLPYDLFLVMLLLMGIGMICFGDILIGWKITRRWVKPWYESCPPGKEVGIALTIAGSVEALFTEKKPHGKREFVFHKQEASVVNHGDYNLHTPNGNSAFIMHEDHDENLNLHEVEYATQLAKELGNDDIKMIYNQTKNKEGDNENRSA